VQKKDSMMVWNVKKDPLQNQKKTGPQRKKREKNGGEGQTTRKETPQQSDRISIENQVFPGAACSMKEDGLNVKFTNPRWNEATKVQDNKRGEQ